MDPFWHWSIGYHSTELSLGYMDSSPSVHITSPPSRVHLCFLFFRCRTLLNDVRIGAGLDILRKRHLFVQLDQRD